MSSSCDGATDPFEIDHGASSDTPADESSAAATAAAALDLRVARRMYYGGFALLPWLWFINWFHFRNAARQPHADPQLATYVHRSLVGAVSGLVLFVAWVVTVSLSWESWGDFGRSIMMVVPEET